jgi:hypothetical protein
MKQLREAGKFVRRLRGRMRFGELSRAPLRLLRLQIREETAECDWMARPPDEWDSELPSDIGERNASLQAILDSMAVRELVFANLPEICGAELRVFRRRGREPPELIITGEVTRDSPAILRVTSPVMRAKLFGFRFCLNDGLLVSLQTEECILELAAIK